jgi:uncharacterized surface protein with fasciclin (FAS1) repeats
MRMKFAWSIPVVMLGLLGWANLSWAQEKKAEPPKKAEEPKKVEPPKKAETPMGKDIVETAKVENLKSFMKALEASGLEKELKGAGPYTVFAPSDEAFKKWADFDNMLKPENKAKLAKILNNHVVKGKHMSADLKKMKEVETMDGKVAIMEKDGAIQFGMAKVTKADVAASNGVIYVIDAVVQPAAGEKPKMEPPKKEEPKKEEPKKPGGGG